MPIMSDWAEVQPALDRIAHVFAKTPLTCGFVHGFLQRASPYSSIHELFLNW